MQGAPTPASRGIIPRATEKVLANPSLCVCMCVRERERRKKRVTCLKHRRSVFPTRERERARGVLNSIFPMLHPLLSLYPFYNYISQRRWWSNRWLWRRRAGSTSSRPHSSRFIMDPPLIHLNFRVCLLCLSLSKTQHLNTKRCGLKQYFLVVLIVVFVCRETDLQRAHFRFTQRWGRHSHVPRQTQEGGLVPAADWSWRPR